MDGGVIVDVRLPVIAGAAHARLFFRNAPVGRHGTVAPVFGKSRVGRRKAVAVFADAVVAIVLSRSGTGNWSGT